MIVDLTEKKPQRSTNQNAYPHVILGLFALEVGETLEYVKKYYYKLKCNAPIYVREREDKYLGTIKVVRSSADLDTAEMTESIERFRNWASGEGCYLPAPNEKDLIRIAEVEVKRNERYIT